MDIRKKQRAVVDALEDIKGRDIVVFNTERLSAYFERVVIASGDSTRQVKALADNVQRKLKALGERVNGTEGGDTAEWVLVDLGDIVVHVMHPTARATYNLEELWGGKNVKMKRETASTLAKPKKKPAAKKTAPAARRTPARKPRAATPPRKPAAKKAPARRSA
jgi:ribosome-associated protein